jgi:steroid 5-alpha reductase family enzyme
MLKVTGIKLKEQQMLKSRGEAYVRYKQTTSGFIPWFKKA